MDLDLGLGAKRPPKKRARVSSHKNVPRVESLAGSGTGSKRGGSAALALDLDPGPKSSDPPASSGRPVSRKPVKSGMGITPGRVRESSRVKQASIPPAPEDKPGLFRSTAPGASEPPPTSTPSPGLALASVPPPAKPKSLPPGGAGNMFGSDDDDEWDGAGALNVGLDYGSEFPPAMSEPASASQPAPDDEPAGPQMDLADPGPSRPPASSLAPSSGAAPPTPKVAAVGGGGPVFSPEEIEAVARYGPVPTNPLMAPMYAAKVFKRRRELQELLKLQKRTHQQATTVLREKLATIADGIIAKAPDQLEGVMGPIRAADQKIADRKVQLEAASGQFASQFKSLQMELESEGAKRQQLDRDRNMAQIKLEDAVHKRAQVSGELKRVNLSIDDAHRKAAAAAGADASFAPPEHAKRITALEAQKVKMIEQMRARDKAVSDAKGELREREGAIRQLESRVNAIHGRQSRMEDEAGQAQNLGLDALKASQHERLVAYEVAIDTIAQQAKSLIDKPTKAQIADVKRQIAGCDADLEKQKLAVDAFDDSAYTRGIAVVVIAAVALVVLLISVARVQ